MSDSWIGKIVGNCRIERKIGEGGCGAVYRGVDLMLERPVAIKVLHGGLAARRDVAERFRSEAHTLARLSHPNIATLYSFHREADTYLMVMEFVEGRTFDELIREHGQLSPDYAVPLFCQALDGIHHAHQAGVIHRDLKGSNVMRSATGLVKVMDFGIARALWSPGLTQADHPLGTPEYMSPEQVRNEEIDARADIYSLGVLLFKMLTGRLPFGGDGPFEIMRAQVEQPPPSARDSGPQVTPAVDEVIRRALAKDRDQRFASAGALRCALEEAHGKQAAAVAPAASTPLPPLPSPDPRTTPIPLVDLAGEEAPETIEQHEAPTRILRRPREGPLASSASWAAAARQALRLAARRLQALAPLVSVPGLAGVFIAGALLVIAALRGDEQLPPPLLARPTPEVLAHDAEEPERVERPPELARLERTDLPAAPEAAERPALPPRASVRRPERARPQPKPPEPTEGWIIRRQ